MAAIVGAFCVAVFVSGRLSAGSAVTVRTCEVHWDVLILGILPLPPWEQPIMPPACKCLAERGRETECESKSKWQRHNRVCEGSMCALLSLKLLFNCHVYPVTTSRVISTQCSVICDVRPYYSTMGSLLLNWHKRRKLTYFMWEIWIHSMELFFSPVSCTFKEPWGQLIFDQSISQGLLLR